jgi:hypothetical protein
LTASEFAFLAFGLVLGIAVGAALVEVIRARPPAPREVRVTVSPDSVPRRRSRTLSTADPVSANAPAPYGPADRRQLERPIGADGVDPWPPAPLVDPRPWTAVGRAIDPGVPTGTPVRSEPLPAFHLPMRYGSVRPAASPADARPLVGIPIEPEADLALEAFRAAEARAAAIANIRPTASALMEPPIASRIAVAPAATADASPGDPDGAATAGGAPTPASAGPCAEERRLADERCALAERARDEAGRAAAALRDEQRAYDDHLTRAERAAATADPRAVRVAKEAAQATFRASRAAARSREDLEAAGRTWLLEINRVNAEAREAAAVMVRERDAANELITVIERHSVAADAARIAAESASEACLVARTALADCEESLATRPASPDAPSMAPGGPADLAAPLGGARPDLGLPDEGSVLAGAHEAPSGGEPRIIRLLRGDRATLERLVAELGGTDPAERRRWQLGLSDLVDALLARAIEAAALEFPPGHPFWGPFTRIQNRDIVAALASLGYRFDGLGGFADGRVPGQRDLSLAVGYAGLDPMRIRRWPTEAEMPDLLRDVAVAADEYIAGAAGGLTLGELVDLLGRRADALADLWNNWGRLRPLLLAAD